MMMTPDVNVVLLDFPNSGKEMVVPNEDGSYTVLINAKLSYATQLKAYEHALSHINEDDFSKPDVQAIEAIAHQVPNVPKDAEYIPSEKFKAYIERMRKEKKKIQRQLKRKEKEIAFIQKHAADPNKYFFNAAEDHWLYGDDL